MFVKGYLLMTYFRRLLIKRRKNTAAACHSEQSEESFKLNRLLRR